MPHLTTNDGVRLHYVERGSGAPLVMIPGWSQTAAQFEHQTAGLSARRRVIAMDMRGHGESEKPEHGYKIQRLAHGPPQCDRGARAGAGEPARPFHGVLRDLVLSRPVRV